MQITIAEWLVSRAESSFNRIVKDLLDVSYEQDAPYDHEEEDHYAGQLEDERRYVLQEWS